jgi:DNA-directed RNA polymerase specialized sigma24 family protein
LYLIKKAEIIEQLSKEQWFKDACRKIAPSKDVAEELYQYAFLVLLEKPNKQIEEIYEGGYLKFYCIRILSNAIHGKFSPFSKNRIYEHEEVADTIAVDESINQKEIEETYFQAIESTLSTLYWYDRKIFELWSNGYSARKIHRETKISVNEVLKVLKKVKQQIIDNYNEHNP